MVNCCVPGCTNYSAKTEEVSYHKIPSDKLRRKAWLHRIRRTNMPPMKYSYVCSDHFLPSNFELDLRSQIAGQKCKRRLKENAVPSEFKYRYSTGTKKTRLSSENRSDRRTHEEAVAELLLATQNDKNTPHEKVIEEPILHVVENIFPAGPLMHDVETQCCFNPITLKSVETQTECLPCACTNVPVIFNNEPFPLPVNVMAEEWKITNDHPYAMRAPSHIMYRTFEDANFNATFQPPLHELEVACTTSYENVGSDDDESDNDDDKDDEALDPNWQLPSDENLPDDDNIPSEDEFDISSSTPDKEKKLIVFDSCLSKLLKRCPECG